MTKEDEVEKMETETEGQERCLCLRTDVILHHFYTTLAAHYSLSRLQNVASQSPADS